MRPAGGEKHAHAGRAAWGVLGSAAGGRVLVCGSEPGRPEQSFGGKGKNLTLKKDLLNEMFTRPQAIAVVLAVFAASSLRTLRPFALRQIPVLY